jgi:cysteine-rich repeat protein
MRTLKLLVLGILLCGMSTLLGCFQQIEVIINLNKNPVIRGESLTFTVTSNPPVTAIIEEAELDGSDLDGFQYSVPYSINTTNLDVGMHTLKVRIVSTRLDGGYAIAEFQVTEPGNGTPPEVDINGGNITIAPGEVTFSATATDVEDGDLSNYLDWSVNGVSQIIGPTLSYVFSDVGTYTVRAAVVDSDGMLGEKTIIVTVTESEYTIQITNVPPFGTPNAYLEGKATGSNLNNCKVCGYLESHELHWWTKPTFNTPCVSINADGTWRMAVTTGGYDKCALKYKVGLYPKDVTPENCGPCFTEPSMTEALASAIADRTPARRTIMFSGREFFVKGYVIGCPEGPGPNYFDPTDRSAYVDNQGYLHLKIQQNSDLGEWTTSEVILNESLGYGTYWTVIKVSDDLFDAMVIAAFFLWDYNSPDDFFKELDFEIAMWNLIMNTNAQFVVQPCNACPGCGDNCTRFQIDPTLTEITVFIDWQPGRAEFRAYEGDFGNQLPDEANLIHSWTKTDGIPVPGTEAVHYNFWLLNGQPPSDGQDREMVIKSFHFDPDHLSFPRCGNNIVEAGETCDDGNTVGGDGCSSTCQTEALCGNGQINSGEQCDSTNLDGATCQTLGFDTGTLTCNTGCQFNTSGCRDYSCGNGQVEPGEECDDGNTSNEDACLNNCRTNVCGDGYLNPAAEACDDGNLINGDGCSSVCQIESECGIKITNVEPADVYYRQAYGVVNCYDPNLYAVALYIKVRGGWWTKPYWAWPVTSINSDGSWKNFIKTGGVDEEATDLCAFLIPADYFPPKRSGETTLPPELYSSALDYDCYTM